MSDPLLADNRSGRDNDALLGGLNRNELIAVFVCSFAGLVLIILMTVLVALLIAIRRKNRRRAYTAQGACRPCKVQDAAYRRRRSSTEIKENDPHVPINIIPLPPRDDDSTHWLHRVSPRNPLSATSNESDTTALVTNTTAIHSSSTDTTVVVDIEENGDGLGEDAVFLENKTESGLRLASTPRAEEHALSSVAPHCGCVHIHCTENSSYCKLISNVVKPTQCQGQTSAHSLPETSCNDQHTLVVDCPTYVNSPSQNYENTTGLQVKVITSSRQEDIVTANSGLNVGSFCEGDGATDDSHTYVNTPTKSPRTSSSFYGGDNATVDSHTYVNTPPRSPRASNPLTKEDHGYVNVHNQTTSLSQPTLTEHSVKCQCHPHYVNVGRNHKSLIECTCGKKSTGVRTTMPLPPRSGQSVAGGSLATGHVTRSTGHVTSSHAPTQHNLPTRSHQSTDQTANKVIPAQECGYVNVMKDQSSPSQTMDEHVAATPSVCISRTFEASTTSDRDYANIPTRRSLSQPNSNEMKLSLLPPRNIPRRSYLLETAGETSETEPATSPSKSGTSEQNRRSPRSSSSHADAIPIATRAMLLDARQSSTPITGGKSRTAPVYSVCDTKHKQKKKGKDACPITDTEERKRSASSTNPTPSPRLSTDGAHSDGEYEHMYTDVQGPRDGGDTLNVGLGIDGGLTDSLESLDIWPPVIPRHSELKFIVPNHSSRDRYRDDIDMVENTSYVNIK